MQQPTVTGVKRSFQRDDEQNSPKRPCLSGQNPSRGQPASWTKLQEKDSFQLFHRIPTLGESALGELALASVQMAEKELDYLVSDEYANRAAIMLDHPDTDTNKACKKIGLALKTATFLFPVPLCLQYFHKFNNKALNQNGAQPPLRALKCSGGILHYFTRGWETPYFKHVFKSFLDHYGLSSAMARFLRDDPGEDFVNEKFLRQHLRLLFLDSCQSDDDRAQWISAIAHELSSQQLANLLVLLYGPTDDQGNLQWYFAVEKRAFIRYTVNFARLSRIVGSLRFMSGWAIEFSLEVLHYITSTPVGWHLCSIAAFLLPLVRFDSGVVVEHLSVLYKSDQMPTASQLLVLVLMISNHYESFSEQCFYIDTDEEEDDCDINIVKLDKRCAYKLIYDIFSNPKLKDERHAIINNFWDCFLRQVRDFAAAALHEKDVEHTTESFQDFQALKNGWKDCMAFATNVYLDAMARKKEKEAA